jgi:nickel-dependent lactate racemase
VAVHEQLVTSAMRLFEVPVPQQYDVVVTGVTTPRDENLYQAARAPIYVGFSPTPVVRQGGVVITPARCPDGPGRAPNEQRFFERLSRASDLRAMLDDLRRNGIQAGEQRAYTLGQVLVNHTVIIVGAECPDVVRDCKMVPAVTMDEAVSIAHRIVGDQASALVLPRALQTLPVVGGY